MLPPRLRAVRTLHCNQSAGNSGDREGIPGMQDMAVSNRLTIGSDNAMRRSQSDRGGTARQLQFAVFWLDARRLQSDQCLLARAQSIAPSAEQHRAMFTIGKDQLHGGLPVEWGERGEEKFWWDQRAAERISRASRIPMVLKPGSTAKPALTGSSSPEYQLAPSAMCSEH